MEELQEKIVSLLIESPGLTARELALKLGVDKKQINSLLYGPLKGQFVQDSEYRWSSAEKKQSKKTDVLSKPLNTPLSQLCWYYLACLSHDEDGIGSVFASSNFDLDYAELKSLPGVGVDDIFQDKNVQSLLGKLRKDRSRLVTYLGYPCSLRHARSRTSSWEGYFVEPIFLLPVEIEKGEVAPRLSNDFPIINVSAIKRFVSAEREAVMEELVQLEEELGLVGEKEVPELDELTQRLRSIRPEWPWQETIDPSSLNQEPRLSSVKVEGIYNRAVFLICERSQITQGLEAELKALADLPEEKYQGTALGDWINETISAQKDDERASLIEVLPLNSEQRQSVQQALHQSLTVITGPPGTGKSQVVSDLLINAAWQGKKVLFASKNNKAVDVVEVRVNNLGPRPILLRVGKSEYQSRLAEYLMSLLSATATDHDRLEFQEASAMQVKFDKTLEALDGEARLIIDQRNKVDLLEQVVEPIRKDLSESLFALIRNLDLKNIENETVVFNSVLSLSIKTKQPIYIKLLWPFFRKERYSALFAATDKLRNFVETIKIEFPTDMPTDASISKWESASLFLNRKLEFAKTVKEYFKELADLQKLRSLEDISKEQAELFRQMADNAETLWHTWLHLQPDSISEEDRRKLSQYKAILKMVIDLGPDTRLSQQLYREYHALFPKVAHLLPCWAVTSLSAKGKIPFQAGFFDVVVFDEASQCDIASALPLLYRAKRAVIIGDPKQLSHISGLPRGQDQQLMEKHGLIKSRSEWAYSFISLFDLASGFCKKGDIVNLRDHHRSHEDIIEFSNREFYEGRLRIATKYDRLKRLSPKEPGVRWENVRGKVQKPAGGGAFNSIEAEAVLQALRKLVLQQNYSGSIGVVTPFRAQANLIREIVNKDETLSTRLIQNEFLVDTVHKFQGDERDMMIFSPVVSQGFPPGAQKFLANNGNLFNVAITRAKAMLLIVGDVAAAGECGVGYLENFARYVQGIGTKQVQEVNDFMRDLGSVYPVVTYPDRVSDWERDLYKVLYAVGIRPLPQYQVEKYTLDFALFNDNRRLNIEVDGEAYHRSWDGELCRRDQLRNQRLFELGWDVKRFWVYEIRDDLQRCIDEVKVWIG